MADIELARGEDGIAVVTLNRPEKKNAVTLAMWSELADVFHALGQDDAVRAVIVTGAGGCFSAGADIMEFPKVRADAAGAAKYEESVVAAEHALAEMPKPTVAAISGFCIGGSCALACCADFRVADATARFGIPTARLGTVYTIEETRALMRVVNPVAAKRILFSAEQFDVATADRLGLVDAIVEGDVVEGGRRFLARMARNAPLSIAGGKAIVHALADGGVDARRDALLAAIDRAHDSADYREGVASFAERREPRFSGR